MCCTSSGGCISTNAASTSSRSNVTSKSRTPWRRWFPGGLPSGKGGRLALSFLLGPLVNQFGQILIPSASALANLSDNAAPLKLQLVTVTEIVILAPVVIADEISSLVIDHNPSIESMVLEPAILPSLLFSSEIMGKQTGEVQDGRTSRGGLGTSG